MDWQRQTALVKPVDAINFQIAHQEFGTGGAGNGL